MLVTMQNSELIDKLVTIAGGDIDLVQDAVRAAALRGLVQRNEYVAELGDVVDYIRAKSRMFRDERPECGRRRN